MSLTHFSTRLIMSEKKKDGKHNMTVQIAKPGEVAIVQVPANWSPKQTRQEQGRIQRHIDKTSAPIHVVVVSGGADSSPADTLEDLLDGEEAEPELAAAE